MFGEDGPSAVGNAQSPSNDLNASHGKVDMEFKLLWRHSTMSELANSEGAGAANLKEFEYLLTLS